MELDRNWEACVAVDTGRQLGFGTSEPTDSNADQPETTWYPIDVPGHWANHPQLGSENGPILYRNRFTHPTPTGDERWWLHLDGIFYQGDVWLDGHYVGDTEGYFFPHLFDVTEALADREDHTLGIEVTCAPESDRRAKRNITGVFHHSDAADQDLNPGGIWRAVRLERTGPIRIRHLRTICTDADEESATVAFRAVLDAAEPVEVTLRSTVGTTEQSEERRLAAGENQVEWQLTIENPELWWPRALGDPILHDVVVEVIPHLPDDPDRERDPNDEDPDAGAPDRSETHDERADDAPAPALGEVSHRIERRIGLRQIHFRGWVLHINGMRLFAKGVNLAPTRMLLADATPDELRADVQFAEDANLDLIRVMGHITRPELYQAADEAGMLVWQDFPLRWGYARTIRKQAIRQAREAVDLLGHHPSLVIWCVHDDPDRVGEGPTAAAVGTEGGRGRFDYLLGQGLPSWNRTILDRSVRRAIDRADGSRPVIPHSGVLPHPPQLDGTDSHLHLGWYRGRSTDLADLGRMMPRMVRFVSRFGTQSVPETAGFMQPEHWPDLDWERLERHHGMQKEIFDHRVPPADHPTFDAWRSATQAHQTEVLTRQIETLRRLKYRPTGGFALMMLADGQPAVSWSLLDHDRVPKPAYDAVREVCRPVIVAADALPDPLPAGSTIAIDVHVVNDLREPVDDLEVRATLRWEGGEHRWRFTGRVDADDCVRVGTLPIEVPEAPGPARLDLELDGSGLDRPHRRTARTRIVVP